MSTALRFFGKNLPDQLAETRGFEMASNLNHWQEMQERGYFENHPIYQGLHDLFPGEVSLIESFVPLASDNVVAVIGCGYGRESVHIAKRVSKLYGIDVNKLILEKAVGYTKSHGVENFVPIEAASYDQDIREGLDLVFSIVVMQHLTRDLVCDYFSKLGAKLKDTGSFVVQFLEHTDGGGEQDAQLRTYEPSVSWSPEQIEALAKANKLMVTELRTSEATPAALWHWAHFKKVA